MSEGLKNSGFIFAGTLGAVTFSNDDGIIDITISPQGDKVIQGEVDINGNGAVMLKNNNTAELKIKVRVGSDIEEKFALAEMQNGFFVGNYSDKRSTSQTKSYSTLGSGMTKPEYQHSTTEVEYVLKGNWKKMAV